MLNHIFTTNYINIQENVVFRAQAEKGIARHIDKSSVLWILIDNGKLANQIARLVGIALKKKQERGVSPNNTGQPEEVGLFIVLSIIEIK